MISEHDLFLFNQMGFIPGPYENEESFLERIHSLKNSVFPSNSSFEKSVSAEDWKPSLQLLQHLFDLSPEWIKAVYDNTYLAPWQAAATWIEDQAESFPVLRLNKAFEKGSYLKIYRREEVLAHEAVHAARMAFNEPKFEEFFAYSTSTTRLRMWLGPIFVHARESSIFLSSIALSLASQVALFFWEDNLICNVVFFLPWILGSMGVLRLAFKHLIFSLCKKKLKKLIKDPCYALAVMMRLTDAEIVKFAKNSLQEIQEYFNSQRTSSLRWRMLYHVYFN